MKYLHLNYFFWEMKKIAIQTKQVIWVISKTFSNEYGKQFTRIIVRPFQRTKVPKPRGTTIDCLGFSSALPEII